MCASGKRKEKEGENPRTSAHVAGRTRRSGSPLFSLNGGAYCGEENKKRRQTLVCQRLCFRRAKYNAVCGKCQGSKAAFVELTSCANKQGPGFGKMPKISGRLRFRGRGRPPPAGRRRPATATGNRAPRAPRAGPRGAQPAWHRPVPPPPSAASPAAGGLTRRRRRRWPPAAAPRPGWAAGWSWRPRPPSGIPAR